MSEQGSAKTKPLSRRDFLKLLGAGGTAIAFAPFVPWGEFTPNPQNDNLQRAKVILPDGTHANVNTFPVNYAEVVLPIAKQIGSGICVGSGFSSLVISPVANLIS